MKKDFGPIEFIQGKNVGRYPFCHSLYVKAQTKILVDPGSDRSHLRDVVSKRGVDCVWLSHAHEDHFKDLDLFMDSALWAPQKGARSLESLEDLFDAYGMASEERQIFFEPMLRDFHYKPRRVDRYFSHEELIDLGGVTVQIIPTPGHTAGHCSFLFQEQELLFLGDYDLTPFGPYYGDVDSDIDETIASVNKLRSLPAKVWIASHETGIFETDPGPLWDEYLTIIGEREAKLLDFLKTSPTMPQIVDACIIYGKKREPAWFFEFGERMLMGKHLERLIRQSRVALNNGVYQRIDS